MALNISIAGGDTRQFYMLHRLITRLSKNDCFIKYFQPAPVPLEFQVLENSYFHSFATCSSTEELFADCEIFIGPAPFSRDGIHLFSTEENVKIPLSDLKKMNSLKYLFGGNIPAVVTNDFAHSQTELFDFMKLPDFIIKNSDLTAEGLLRDIIANTPSSIKGSRILVSGYGNCGRAIAEKLSALEGDIYVYDRDAVASVTAKAHGYSTIDLGEEQNLFPSFNMVVNTVPAQIFETSFLRKLRKSCVLFDIASAPGGFDDTICQGLSLKLVNCPGIPGKTAPKAAGYAMADCVLEQLNIETIPL